MSLAWNALFTIESKSPWSTAFPAARSGSSMGSTQHPGATKHPGWVVPPAFAPPPPPRDPIAWTCGRFSVPLPRPTRDRERPSSFVPPDHHRRRRRTRTGRLALPPRCCG
jgi:hypothetical protein